jgi:hypothetical protein
MTLFLLSTLVTTFHHHHDDSTHHDCPLCVAGSHFSPAAFNKDALDVFQSCIILRTTETTHLYIPAHSAFRSTRAPPA